MSGYLAGLECSRCATYYPGDTPRRALRLRRARCSPATTWRRSERRSRPTKSRGAPPTMWRYRELLPVRDDASIVTMGEGFTPMIPVPKAAREVGVGELWVKDEGVNPTGTFKARGASASRCPAGRSSASPGSPSPPWGAAATPGPRTARAPACEVHTALPVECPELGWKGSLANGARVYRIDGTIGDVSGS